MMVLLASWTGLWKEDLAPRKHMITESSREKAILQQINPNVLLYGCASFLDRTLASLLNATVALLAFFFQARVGGSKLQMMSCSWRTHES